MLEPSVYQNSASLGVDELTTVPLEASDPICASVHSGQNIFTTDIPFEWCLGLFLEWRSQEGKANLRCPQAILEGPHMDIVIAHSRSHSLPLPLPCFLSLAPPPSLSLSRPPSLPPEPGVHSFIYSVRLVIPDCQNVLRLKLETSDACEKKPRLENFSLGRELVWSVFANREKIGPV